MQITFDDDKTLADFNMAVLKGYEKSLMPSITGNTTNVPGKIGAWDHGDELGTLSDTYGIASLTQNPLQRERDIAAFYRYITDDFGYPRELKIILSIEPHLYFTAKLIKPKAPKRYNSGADFELSVIATNPRKYSRFKQDEIRWGSTEINFTFPYQLGHRGTENNISVTKPTELAVHIDGYSLKPVIMVGGTGTNVIITNKGQSILLGSFTSANWKIDCSNYVVIKNGVEQFIDFDEFILFSGDNQVTISGSNLNLTLSIEYRDEY